MCESLFWENMKTVLSGKRWFDFFWPCYLNCFRWRQKSRFLAITLFSYLIFSFFPRVLLSATENFCAFKENRSEKLQSHFIVRLSVLYYYHCILKYVDSKLSDTSEIALLFAENQNSNNTWVLFDVYDNVQYCIL